jgi:pimeloyl-ACP methyl ester carboxylesterase
MQLLKKSILLLLAALVFFVLLGIVLTWRNDKPVEELKARWAGPPSQFVAVAGMQIHVRDEGPRDDPAPIVLLHGTSASLHTWDGWAQALRGQRRVIRLDLPGFALTGPSPANDYSLEAYVQVVTALLDQMGVRRFVVGGNSLGGGIAWSLAHALPQRVDRLILVDASGYPPESGTTRLNIPLGFRVANMPVLKHLVRYTLPRGVVEQSVRSVYGHPEKVTPELVDLYMDMALREGNRAALVRRIEQGYTGKSENLKTLTMPTLILWGGKDGLVPPEFALRFERDIKGSKLVMFDDLGHVPQEEDPARTVAEVKRFLGM